MEVSGYIGRWLEIVEHSGSETKTCLINLENVQYIIKGDDGKAWFYWVGEMDPKRFNVRYESVRTLIVESASYVSRKITGDC